MFIFKYIDPFLLQLVIIPIMVVGIGVLASMKMKRFYMGPIITLLLNMAIETLVMGGISSWCIIYPLVSLVLSFMFAQGDKITA